MSSRNDLFRIAIERMRNGIVIEQVWPTREGYAWRAALVTGSGRVLNWRRGASSDDNAAQELAEGAGMWLGNHHLAFVLGPDGNAHGTDAQRDTGG